MTTLKPASVLLKPARPDHELLFFRLRNDPKTVANSRSHARVLGAEHEAWYAAALASPTMALFVAVAGTTLVGTGRLERGAEGAEVSLVVAPEWRGRGYGTAMVQGLVGEAGRRGWAPCWAEVHPENHASRRAFERAGFELARWLRLERR